MSAKAAHEKSQKKKSKDFNDSDFPTQGSPKVLVVLAEFSNARFAMSNPKEAFSNLLNQEGYSSYGATGSCKDYFKDNSMGAFSPEFVVYGPAKLPNTFEKYGANDIQGRDVAPEQMIIDACQALDGEIDFSQFDINKDGKVDNVYVFYAGYGAADGGGASRIWPHASDLTNKHIVLDGVELGSYACSNEVNFETKEITGIGVFTHEFCHVLGLPDLYDTAGSGAFTPGSWCLMDYGEYNNHGKTPPCLTAFERMSLGWLTPEELTDPANCSLEPISENKAYRISTNADNEFFLLENRQNQGWDNFLEGYGMLVWHIDYDNTIWNNNSVNNISFHQRVDILEADNVKDLKTVAGDAFPGTAGVTQITDDTNPNMRTWAGIGFGKTITSIEETDGIVHFRYRGGQMLSDAPRALDATDISMTGFTANWSAVDNAGCYLLSVYMKNADATISEIFDFVDKNVGNVQSFAIEGLDPENTYYYTVKAADNFSTTGASNEVMVTTLPPTFDFIVPEANPAKEIKATSFVANWNTVESADSYLLNVYTKNRTEDGADIVDFSNGLDLPHGWTTDSQQTISMSGYYGQEKPALMLSEDGSVLSSPIFDNGIVGFKFWYRGRGKADGNSLSVLINNGKRWVEVDKLEVEKDGNTYVLNPDLAENAKAFRLRYNKGEGGNVVIDDVEVKFGSSLKSYVDEFNHRDVGNASSVLVEGLAPNTTYYYTIMAKKGIQNTKLSNEVKVMLGDGSVEEIHGNDFACYSSGGTIYIISEEHVAIQIYSVSGSLILTKECCPGTTSVEDLPQGIYILKTPNSVTKLIL